MKDDYISRKENWARKNAGAPPARIRSPDRLPPGQHQVHNFPVLDLGEHPVVPLDQWQLAVHGLVERPTRFSWAEFKSLPSARQTSDFHCVTTWSQFDLDWEGVPFKALADLIQPKPAAKFVFFKSHDTYTTNAPLEACLGSDVLIAHTLAGQPIPVEHGGPARILIPKLYAWKSAKFIREIIFLEQDLLGFWELRGYSNSADPWLEERHSDNLP